MGNKYSISLIILICLMLGCTEKPVRNVKPFEIKTLNGLHLSPFADSLFMEFTKEVHSDYAYAIYLDKKDYNDYVITFAPFKHPIKSLYDGGTANYFMLNDTIPVFLYSGIEDYLYADSTAFSAAHKHPRLTGEWKEQTNFMDKMDFSKAWTYVILPDTSYIVTGTGQTFIEGRLGTTIKFTPPDDVIQKTKPNDNIKVQGFSSTEWKKDTLACNYYRSTHDELLLDNKALLKNKTGKEIITFLGNANETWKNGRDTYYYYYVTEGPQCLQRITKRGDSTYLADMQKLKIVIDKSGLVKSVSCPVE